MAKTYAKADMSFIDVTALDEAVEYSSDNASFGDIAHFKSDSDTADYINLGLNYTVLDGTKAEMPDEVADICFMSDRMSDSSGSFKNAPAIEISFTTNHSSAGLTLHFVNEIPAAIRIIWYSLGGSQLDSAIFKPTSLNYFVNRQVLNYGKIIIEFVSTSTPERYVFLNYILYGLEISWYDTMIKSAKVTEEVDETNDTLPINTAEITILDADSDFDPSNTNGRWNAIQKNQKISLSEYNSGSDVTIGTFYVKTWSFSDNTAKFSLHDTIGYIDAYTYYGGIYNNVTVETLIEGILSLTGVEYEIEEELKSLTLSGYLGICTCREALQQVCFSIGAVADCSRSDKIKIFTPDRYISHYIGIDRKFSGGTVVELDDYVSGIKITSARYKLSGELSEIYNDELPAGNTRIEYSDPYSTKLVLLNCKLVEAHVNYCVVYSEYGGEATISGYKYESNEFSLVKTETLSAGEMENIKEFTCQLYSNLLWTVINRLLSFYEMRKLVQIKYLISEEMVGDWCGIKDKQDNLSATLIYSQTIDLSNGFIATAKCRGYNKVVTNDYYTGSELIANGDIII